MKTREEHTCVHVHFNKGLSILTVPLSTQVHAQMGISKFNAEGNPVMDQRRLHDHNQGGEDTCILLVTSRYRKRDKLQHDGPLWLVQT